MALFAFQAAVACQGVALGTTALTMDMLAAGSLVKPFDLELPATSGYHIVCPPEHRARPHVAAFIAWLLETAGAVAGRCHRAAGPSCPRPAPPPHRPPTPK